MTQEEFDRLVALAKATPRETHISVGGFLDALDFVGRQERERCAKVLKDYYDAPGNEWNPVLPVLAQRLRQHTNLGLGEADDAMTITIEPRPQDKARCLKCKHVMIALNSYLLCLNCGSRRPSGPRESRER